VNLPLKTIFTAGTNLLEFHDAFVTSVDYAKATEVKNLLLDTPWDLVIVDEAHQVAKPHQSRPEHKIKKERWQLATEISASKKNQAPFIINRYSPQWIYRFFC
jgi:hypothetical protein